MRVISLDRLRVLSSVGILPHEMQSKQPLLISIGVDLPDAPTLPVQDDVRHVLDYRQLRDIAKAESEGGHVNMLETLAGRFDGIAVEITAHRDAAAPLARS
jgi:7,8-dihydroneopterin aldolase/epimerase/oxygenase